MGVVVDELRDAGEQVVVNNLEYLDTEGERGREKGGAVTRQVWEDYGRDRDRGGVMLDYPNAKSILVPVPNELRLDPAL